MDRPHSIVLAGGGAALAFALTPDGPPVVTHWGAALPPEAGEELAATAVPAVLHSSFDGPRSVSALPGQPDGWSGTSPPC